MSQNLVYVVGPSGAGKSTLANTLLGRAAQATAAGRAGAEAAALILPALALRRAINATGVGLTQSDLLRNYLFMAEELSIPVDKGVSGDLRFG